MLYDDFVEDVPKDDITRPLYLSPGVFNYRQGKAVAAVAWALWESRNPPQADMPAEV